LQLEPDHQEIGMSGPFIDTIAGLEAVIGQTPPQMFLKDIDHLDAGSLRWIGQSPLMFATFAEMGAEMGEDAACVRVTLAGGSAGFAAGEGKALRVPLDLLDDPGLPRPGQSFGSLFLLPGIGETLRVNGRVRAVADGVLHVAVQECYGHCAKALIRSRLWSAEPVTAADEAAGFVAESRFLALATVSREGRADLSPKGDPAGSLARLDAGDGEDLLWFADRPGNRRVDSFRNIVQQPALAMALLVPGSTRVAMMRGRAALSTDEAERARFAVQGKVPALAVRVKVEEIGLRTSAALERAGLWPLGTSSDIDPARLFVDHIKLNRTKGLAATLARASLSVPGASEMVKKGLAQDYKDNLY